MKWEQNLYVCLVVFKPSKEIPILTLVFPITRAIYNYQKWAALFRTGLLIFQLGIVLKETAESWVVVVVKWSVCSPSTPTIRVRIPAEVYKFSVKVLLKRTKINK